MFPNLMGMQKYHKLSNEEMGQIINVSRQTFETKMDTGKFTLAECKLLCQYFKKSFDYLFATIDEVEAG